MKKRPLGIKGASFFVEGKPVKGRVEILRSKILPDLDRLGACREKIAVGFVGTYYPNEPLIDIF